MKISDALKIHAPVGVVWKNINNFEFVASCMPGVENVVKVDEKTYQAVITQTFLHIRMSFDMVVVISQARENEFIEIHGTGKNKMLGGLVLNLVASLNPVSQEETDIKYDCEINVTGKLATMGQKAIALKANQLQKDFSKAFKDGSEKK